MVLGNDEGVMEPITGESKKRVCYFFDSDIGNYHYGPGHPMKPTRIRMCHSLVMNYGLYKKMEIFRAKPATKREMSQFHTDEYVDFLYRINPENASSYMKEQVKYNVGDDCPVFDGLFEYCSISAGGSMEGAARLSRDKCDIAVNWAGGLHHAKKAEASGFCYVNDIVLGILELLRYHVRVLYIDIDVHHGDGVEEAFYTTDRVMTLSFHKYGEFFPGTGAFRDTGIGKGAGYAVNVPLRDGVTDESYQQMFQDVVGKCVQWYEPTAIVLQCGADSLAGDKIGCFNLSMKGHANCVEYVKKFNLPLLMLGGGGYTIKAVSRAWAYETGLAAGQRLGMQIPSNEYYEYFGPDYNLDVRANNMEDMNTPEFMDKLKRSIFENLRDKTAAPSVQMQAIPKLPHDDDDNVDEDMEDPDQRLSAKQRDARIQKDGELSDSEDEGLGGRKHRQNHSEQPRPHAKRKRTPLSGRTSKEGTPVVGVNGGGNVNGVVVGGSGTTRSRTRSPSTVESRRSRTPAPAPPPTVGTAVTTVPPPPHGTVVSTGLVIPTAEIIKAESNGDAGTTINAHAGPSTSSVPAPPTETATATATETTRPVKGTDEMDVDIDAVVADLERDIESGRIDEEIGRKSDGGLGGVDVDVSASGGTEVAPAAEPTPAAAPAPAPPPPAPTPADQPAPSDIDQTTAPPPPPPTTAAPPVLAPSAAADPVKPVFSNTSIMPLNDVEMEDVDPAPAAAGAAAAAAATSTSTLPE